MLQKTYLETGIIHADLSDYNIIVKPDMHVLIIEFAAIVTKEHPNAQDLLMRDLKTC